MIYLPAEIIKKKRNGHELTADEIRFMIGSYTRGEMPDYQMSAWLMAIYFKDMTPKETTALTEAMLHSGRVLDFSQLPGTPVDKHSTGGVGDKTTMILAPIVAACGVKVPMIAGRGLGHTGGTLDKLEAIPGFRIDLGLDRMIAQVEKLGLAIIGQTGEICPADKKIYALRDVTATIESYPLICASIMSKKLAEGIGALVLDVKHGTGAFMKTVEMAEGLADKLMEIGTNKGKRVSAFLTTMDQPLGHFIGNSLEIGECIAILKNESYRSRRDFDDTRDLSLELAAEMIWLAGGEKTREAALAAANAALSSGRAWEMFEKLCAAQGGDPAKLPEPKSEHVVLAETDGFVSGIDSERLGVAAIKIGAGRVNTSDSIDPTAGIEIHKKLGDSVKKGEPLYTIFASEAAGVKAFAQAKEMALAATKFSLQKPHVPALISKRKTNVS